MPRKKTLAPVSSKSVQIHIIVAPSAADADASPYVRVSAPLPRGRFRTTPGLSLMGPKGKAVSVQGDVLTHWPDGTVRVVHLTFPVATGAGVYTLSAGGRPMKADTANAILCRRERNGHIRVSTGALTAVIGGPHLLQSVRAGTVDMIRAGGLQLRVVDEQGRLFDSASAHNVRTVIETAGPLRTVVSVQGKHALGTETLIDFRIRFEFLAGVEGFSLLHTFFNLEPGRDILNVHSIAVALALANVTAPMHTVYQSSYGLFSTQGRVVTTPERLHIAVDDKKASAYVANYEALGDEHHYPFYLNPPADKVDNWAAVSDGKRSILVEMDDFDLLRPKSLELEGGRALFGVWPTEAGPLALPQGRSRQVTVRVRFSNRGVPASHADAQAAVGALRDTWRAQLPSQAYAQTNFFDQGRVFPYEPHVHPRFENWLGTMSGILNSVARFFDLGDTPDSGYQSTYIPIGERIRRTRGEDTGPRYFSTGLHHPATKLNGLDDFEPVWVNNEYDVNYVLGTEFLRTGDLSLFQKLRWWCRHTIDVDFVHYSDHKWLHRAQPAHCERHTRTGAYPSHFWTQGLAQYYMLTGDPDALEVIAALADKTIENLDDPVLGGLHGGLNREVGWGILTMVCAYEATGSKRYDDYARELIEREIACGLPADLPYFSFGHTSILLGVRQYLQVHEGDATTQPIRQWFLDFVDHAILCANEDPRGSVAGAGKAGRKKKAGYSYDLIADARGLAMTKRSGILGGITSMALDSLAYAYELTGNEDYIRAGLRTVEVLVDCPWFRSPIGEGKPYAMIYRTYANYFKAAAALGYLKDFEYRH